MRTRSAAHDALATPGAEWLVGKVEGYSRRATGRIASTRRSLEILLEALDADGALGSQW